MSSHSAAEAVTSAAHKIVSRAEALRLLDQARRILDGRYDRCLLCESEPYPVLVELEDADVNDEPLVDMDFRHLPGCPVEMIAAASRALRDHRG